MRATGLLITLVGLLAGSPACKKDGGTKSEGKDEAKSAESAPPSEEPAEEPAAAPDPEPPATGPVAPSAEEQVTADKAAVVMEELGKIAEGAKGNCDKAATAMKGVIGKNKAVLSAAAKLGANDGVEQWLDEKYGPRTDAAKSKLMPLMEKCVDHEGMATVFDAIE